MCDMPDFGHFHQKEDDDSPVGHSSTTIHVRSLTLSFSLSTSSPRPPLAAPHSAIQIYRVTPFSVVPPLCFVFLVLLYPPRKLSHSCILFYPRAAHPLSNSLYLPSPPPPTSIAPFYLEKPLFCGSPIASLCWRPSPPPLLTQRGAQHISF